VDITAVIPVYNCKDRLERHLQGVREWIDFVKEVIVVDSGSTDGTLELAREILCPYGAQFIYNPPGLYQSWNAGVAAATQKYLYFSTVEDPITVNGLRHLHELMIAHDADVVISPPEMRNQDGSERVEVDMPSNRLAAALSERGFNSVVLSKPEAIALLCGLLPHGILGSSASNLYKTDLLKQYPFPTNFGHCGDTAWGVSVSPVAKIAFTTQECAQFLMQTKHSKVDPETQKKLHWNLANFTKNILQQGAGTSVEVATMSGWFSFLDLSMTTMWEWTAGLEGYNQELKRDVDALLKQVDYLKEAIITIKQLQERNQCLEKENQKVNNENKSYQGFKGAIKCLRNSLRKQP